MLLGKLNAIETHLEENFSNLHTQIAKLTCKSKQDINIMKSMLHKLENCINTAQAAIKDLQQESKVLKDSKSFYQRLMDEQASEIQILKADLKLQDENETVTPAVK